MVALRPQHAMCCLAELFARAVAEWGKLTPEEKKLYTDHFKAIGPSISALRSHQLAQADLLWLQSLSSLFAPAGGGGRA
jgi:hypothetical protein